MDDLKEWIKRLEYHQKLLMGMIQPTNKDFDLLIIQNGLTEREVEEFHLMCEVLLVEMERQKAENFVFHSPLFKQFTAMLNGKLQPQETIQACLKQNIHSELMRVLWLNIK